MSDGKTEVSDDGVPKVMKAIWTPRHGGYEVLQYREDAPIPNVYRTQVLIRVHAAALNPVDNGMLRGQGTFVLPVKSMPTILGFDACGTIVRVGDKVTKWKVGDEVMTMLNWTKTGAFAEYVSQEEIYVAAKPKNMSFEEAAGLPLVGLTVYQAAVDKAHVKKGDRVLIAGGSGGIGTFAIQFCKWQGAHVTATCSPRNVELVKALGADAAVDYNGDEWYNPPEKYDVVIDAVGPESMKKAYKAVKSSGRVVSIKPLETNELCGLQGGWGIGKHVTSIFFGAAFYAILTDYTKNHQLKHISQLVEEGHIRAVIDSVHPLKNIIEAFKVLESSRARGKIIVSVIPTPGFTPAVIAPPSTPKEEQ